MQWLGERSPASLGAPLSSLPRVQEAVGHIEGLLLANRLQLDALSTQPLTSQEAGLIKVAVTENAVPSPLVTAYPEVQAAPPDLMQPPP